MKTFTLRYKNFNNGTLAETRVRATGYRITVSGDLEFLGAAGFPNYSIAAGRWCEVMQEADAK